MKKRIALCVAVMLLLSVAAFGAEATAANVETGVRTEGQVSFAEIENTLLQEYPYCKVYSEHGRVIADVSLGKSTSALYSVFSEFRDLGVSADSLKESLQTVNGVFRQFYKKIETLLAPYGMDQDLQVNFVDDTNREHVYLTIINEEIVYDIYSELITEETELAETGRGSGSGETALPTVGEKNALSSAMKYLKYTAFSYLGLIEQLEYEGYTREEAVYAVENCGADWHEQAEKSAKKYLSYTAFSYSGLVAQLEYEGYTKEEAVHAVENCGADWNEQAAKTAENYLKYSSFSKSGLIDQLIYEGFTREQAEYGVSQCGY